MWVDARQPYDDMVQEVVSTIGEAKHPGDHRHMCSLPFLTAEKCYEMPATNAELP